MDAEGNVMGLRKGSRARPVLAVVAHLDTVFPEGTDVKVKRAGTRADGAGHRRRHARLALCSRSIRALKRRSSRRRATSCSSAMSAKKARAICAA